MHIHSIPDNEEVSNDYKVTINGVPVELYRARVSAVIRGGYMLPLFDLGKLLYYLGLPTPREIFFLQLKCCLFRSALQSLLAGVRLAEKEGNLINRF